MSRGPEDQSIKERFPAWSPVWHRASERKGIVYGYVEYCDGRESVYVDWGSEVGPIEPELITSADPEKEFSTSAE